MRWGFVGGVVFCEAEVDEDGGLGCGEEDVGGSVGGRRVSDETRGMYGECGRT